MTAQVSVSYSPGIIQRAVAAPPPLKKMVLRALKMPVREAAANPISLIGTLRLRTSVVVLWLRLCSSKAGVLGSIPGQGTRIHMLQLRVRIPQLRPGAAK